MKNVHKAQQSVAPGVILSAYIQSGRRGYDTQAKLARALRVTTKTVSVLAGGRAPITIRMALRLERVYGVSADLWVCRQALYDLYMARKRLAARKAV